MSKALTRTSEPNNARGLVAGGASVVLPGLGQLINGESSKGLGIFVVWAVAGASVLGWIPVIGAVAKLVALGTWVYGVADGFFTGRKK